MNKLMIALLPLLAAANAGIYSATWPEGEVPAMLILRSGHVGLQGVDSATHNPGYVPQFRSDLVEESSSLNLEGEEKKDSLKLQEANIEPENADEEKENNQQENENIGLNDKNDSIKPAQELNEKDNSEEERDSDQVNRAQIGLRSDLQDYVNIGHMQNHPPNAWQTWRYQPKRVRSVIIEETDAKPTGVVESPEAPASTAKTPELNQSEPEPSAIVEKPEATVPSTQLLNNLEQIAENEKQLRYGYLNPSYHYYGNRQPIRYNPSYQSATTVAQNAPGLNYAASSANSQGFGNGAAVSQAVNLGELQSAVSSANNNQGSAIAAAQNNGRLSSSTAQAFNNRGHIRYIAPQYQSATATAFNHN